eukprot:5731085-Amphidinium_carterae.1
MGSLAFAPKLAGMPLPNQRSRCCAVADSCVSLLCIATVCIVCHRHAMCQALKFLTMDALHTMEGRCAGCIACAFGALMPKEREAR